MEVVKALQKFGYSVVHQKGSHIKLSKVYPSEKHIIVVPRHKELDLGTLRSIVKRLGKYISEEDFLKELTGH
ncbi:MAG: type II toxin-antitoxin system HicA family toxin [Candidatus Omnitrophica bacterium]|nr:type II toxin-antitoxin system HicA family toxin [Candidatus Omnitrophota bacterium]